MRPASTGSIPEERAVGRDPRGAGASDVGIRRASLVSLVVHGLVGWAACGALMGGLMADRSASADRVFLSGMN